MPLSIMFQSFNTHVLTSGLSGGSCFMPLYSVIYHTFDVARGGGGFKGLVLYATFNIVSFIFHTLTVDKGAQEAHVLCHFQYCLSHLPHFFYRNGGGGGGGGGFMRLMFSATFNIVSVIYHSFTVGKGAQETDVFLTLSIIFQSFTTSLL